jgi:hypothetical protein
MEHDMPLTIRERVQRHLELGHHHSPTEIGEALGYSYGRASSAVNPALKALVAEGWAERTSDAGVKYREKTPQS